MSLLADTAVDPAELLGRCAKGDQSALNELYVQVSPQLFGVLLRILRRTDLAEEALQDVFVSIWRNAATYRPEKGHPVGWLVTIARYRALDIRRSRRFEVPMDETMERAQEQLQTPEPGPMANTLRAEDTRQLSECLDSLGLAQQRCITLAYLDGCTHEEIATRVGSPLGTVKSWVRRGLQALKECLQR
jgi:RNA polymerase sigma-70 factor (ECF subfamily)